MSIKKGLLTVAGLSLLAAGPQLPAQAQELAAAAATETLAADLIAVDSMSIDTVSVEDVIAAPVAEPSSQFAAPTVEEESIELAQARRRTRGATSGNFIGIGADFSTADDVSFAVISKFNVSDQVAFRPSVLIGDDFAVLAPVTYEFNATSLDNLQVRPYAGAGVSYIDTNNNNNSDIGLLLAAGVDVPVSRRFTFNAQANYAGVFSNNSNFGGTVGIGYNF